MITSGTVSILPHSRLGTPSTAPVKKTTDPAYEVGPSSSVQERGTQAEK